MSDQEEPYVFEFGELERTAYLVQHGEPSHRARLLRVIAFRERVEKAELDHTPMPTKDLRQRLAEINASIAIARTWAESYNPDEPAWDEAIVMSYQSFPCATCGTVRPIGDLAWVEHWTDQDCIRIPYCHPAMSTGPTCYTEASHQ